VPGVRAGLPSEAQWEYACRAGRGGPFWFGANVTPEQVNYDGRIPYAGGATGAYRARPVPVGSLPPNGWGLYEMHGNVWEWCADWYGVYADGVQVDPTGPGSGAHRVLRGGSWIGHGRHARSAARRADSPGYRNESIGFRIALGQESGGPAEPAGEPRGTRGEESGA